MENIFDHYDLLEVMEGTEKRPENDPEKSPWVRKSAQGYLLLGQALGSSQIRHIKPFQREPAKGPKAWAALKGVHTPATAAVAVVLERQMAALRIDEGEPVEEGVQKFFDLLTRLEGADLNYSDLQKKTKLLALLPDSCEAASMKGGDYDKDSSEDRYPGQFFFVSTQATAAAGGVEGFEEPATVGKVTLHSLDFWAGMDTSSKGSKTYTARLGERKLWDLHGDRDIYNEMWQIPVVPMPKERQVAASLGAAGAEYFLTIVDVYTRMTWVYVLPKKSDVAETVKTDWLPMVERQQDRLVKAIRTDRGGEFLSKDFSTWLKKQGIRHSLTMPYSPAMNGIAESANRTLTETARGLSH
ncbi:hypothetical protein CLOP_g13773 [Closterium sp. NIES-67]|nr:hypothetical protein CLOP_g13773 [Closterium sp. NIES-67]